jgi:hypothetical protein
MDVVNRFLLFWLSFSSGNYNILNGIKSRKLNFATAKTERSAVVQKSQRTRNTSHFMKRIFLLIISLAKLTPFLFAQDTNNKLYQLNGLIGTWNVSVESRLSADGPWDTSKARSIIKKTTGNTVIEEDLTGNLKNKPFTTKTLIAFNHFIVRFQKIFVDSEHGVLVDYEGQKKEILFFLIKPGFIQTKQQ